MGRSSLKELSEAVQSISAVRGSQALSLICDYALKLTSSRHALIGILNRDQGWIEVRFGAGDQYLSAIGAQLDVDVDQGIVSYVAATGRAFESSNVLSEQIYKRLFESTLSEIAVPIRDRHGRVAAVLNIESDELASYSEQHRHTCEILASLVAFQLENIEQQSREEALIELGYALDHVLTEESLIGKVIQVAGEVLQFQAASLFILDKGSDSFVLVGSTSRLRHQVGEIQYFRGEGCTGWVCEHGRPILLQNPQSDPRWRGRFVEFPSETISSFLCVPIFVKDKCEGALRVLRRKSENPYFDNRFTDDDLRLMEAISEQVGNGLEHVRSLERLLRSEKMIAWGELSAKSSHMIGNRVFALKGDLNELNYLIHEPKQEMDSLKSLSDSLATNVRRIEEILQEFRDFVSATKVDLQVHELDKVLKETVEEVLPKQTPVKILYEFGDDLPLVMIDELKFKRAISELIENSFHFQDSSNQNQSLKIIAKKLTPGEIDLPKSVNHRLKVMIMIEDNGYGVKSEMKDNIFEPFYTSRVKGMGLGLAIVRGIIEAHGGDVFEMGVEGQGAKFVILLPVTERP